MVFLSREEARALLEGRGWTLLADNESSGDVYIHDSAPVGIYLDWDGQLDRSKGMPESTVHEGAYLCDPRTAAPTSERFPVSEDGLLQAVAAARAQA